MRAGLADLPLLAFGVFLAAFFGFESLAAFFAAAGLLAARRLGAGVLLFVSGMMALYYRVKLWSANPLGQAGGYDTQIFSAHLTPHRSMKREHFHLLMMALCGAMFFLSIPFFVLGAWPVLGFMGLDIIGFWWAFHANYKAAKGYEDIHLSHLELQVEKVSPRGKTASWRFNPLWVRLEKHEREEYGIEKLLLVSRQRGLEVASFLGPDQKAEFARDFTLALREAKRGPDLND